MPKIRIYLDKEIIKDHKILLDLKHIHYLKNVMRKKSGDQILAFNSQSEWKCELKLGTENSMKPVKLLRQKNQLPDIWMCFALIKTKNINYLIEKISEIGVKKIIPLVTEFSSKIDIKLTRLKKISIEAIEQSNSISLPQITETQSLSRLLNNWDKERIIIFCDETGGDPIINSKPFLKKFKKIAIFIGPVGGWSTLDKNLFKGKKVFRLSLGENILKADTAAIYSLSCIRALME